MATSRTQQGKQPRAAIQTLRPGDSCMVLGSGSLAGMVIVLEREVVSPRTGRPAWHYVGQDARATPAEAIFARSLFKLIYSPAVDEIVLVRMKRHGVEKAGQYLEDRRAAFRAMRAAARVAL